VFFTINSPRNNEIMSLCSIKQAARHEDVEMDVKIHVFLTSVLDEGEWCASRHGRFIPEE
jgi:hypothetical protein